MNYYKIDIDIIANKVYTTSHINFSHSTEVA